VATFGEQDCDIGQDSADDYTQTKLQAEKEVLRERENGVFSAAIVRVGKLSLDSDGNSQRFETANPLFEEIECLIHLGCVSESLSRIAVTPVDEAAKAIVIVIQNSLFSNLTLHIDNPYPVNLARRLTDIVPGMRSVSAAVFIDFLMLACRDQTKRRNVSLFMKHKGWMYSEKPITTLTLLSSSFSRKLLKYFHFEHKPLSEAAIFKILHSVACVCNPSLELPTPSLQAVGKYYTSQHPPQQCPSQQQRCSLPSKRRLQSSPTPALPGMMREKTNSPLSICDDLLDDCVMPVGEVELLPTKEASSEEEEEEEEEKGLYSFPVSSLDSMLPFSVDLMSLDHSQQTGSSLLDSIGLSSNTFRLGNEPNKTRRRGKSLKQTQ
jgi:hypothetical protein